MSRFKLLLVLFIILLISCRTEHEGDCLNFVSSPVTQVSMLDSGIINQPINIDFYFNANNGCGNFYNFNVNSISDTMVISPVVKYEGCVCTMIFQNLQTTYSYTPTNLGYAYFKFPQSDSSFLMDSIYIHP
ncbi:MAG: hypothetical protein NT127_08520 [Sphingobacteriales bacterium]|nr:hypothetical protein [Sphingobacteriales bacterium]